MTRPQSEQNPESILLSIKELNYRVSPDFQIQNIRFEVAAGAFAGIIGPNGAGKSTVVKLISGLIHGGGANVELAGRPLKDYAMSEKARMVAVVPQEPLPPLDYTVKEVVSMGRFVYQDIMGQDMPDSKTLISETLERMDIAHLTNRQIKSLSGGEKQRVTLAKALVQNPKLLILDEPTAHLDPAHQIHFMNLLSEYKQEKNLAVLAVLHDLNLAAAYCDQLLLLSWGKQDMAGSVCDVLTKDNIKRVYGISPHVLTHPVSGVPQVLF